LQYLHAKLQRRIGMMCASKGWSVESSAPRTFRAPRTVRDADFNFRRRLVRVDGIDGFSLLEHRKELSASF
jgi:hypothetical protein